MAKDRPNGVYVNEVYKGRLVRLEKTDTTYVIQLDNPLAEFSTEDYVDVVEIIKREVGNLQDSEMTDEADNMASRRSHVKKAMKKKEGAK